LTDDSLQNFPLQGVVNWLQCLFCKELSTGCNAYFARSCRSSQWGAGPRLAPRTPPVVTTICPARRRCRLQQHRRPCRPGRRRVPPSRALRPSEARTRRWHARTGPHEAQRARRRAGLGHQGGRKRATPHAGTRAATGRRHQAASGRRPRGVRAAGSAAGRSQRVEKQRDHGIVANIAGQARTGLAISEGIVLIGYSAVAG
jgi:hypothetical protein